MVIPRRFVHSYIKKNKNTTREKLFNLKLVLIAIMKMSKYIPSIFLLIVFFFSLLSLQFTIAGYKNDTTGDVDLADIDIIRLDVEGDLLKITLATTPEINESEHIFYTYNIFVDCDGSATPEYDTGVYEYVAHFKWYYTGGMWRNDSYLMATRYWVDSNHQKHEDGVRWWDKELDQWTVNDPNQTTADVSGNTISFDITTALSRIHYPQVYFFQAWAATGVDLYTNDTAPNSGWVDENSGIPPYSPNTSSTLNSTGILFSIVFLFLVASSVFDRKRK